MRQEDVDDSRLRHTALKSDKSSRAKPISRTVAFWPLLSFSPSTLQHLSSTALAMKKEAGPSIAVVGTSQLSIELANDFLRILFFKSVILVSRTGARDGDAAFKGETKAVEYSQESDEPQETLVDALKGVEVVISCMGGSGLGSPQRQVAKAAAQNGCKLFVTSDFLFDSELVQFASILDAKKEMRKFIGQLQLPSLSVNCGLFPRVVFHPDSNFGFNVQSRKVTIVGDGKQPVSYTTIVDLSRFLANLLRTTKLEDLRGRTLNVQGSKTTLLEVVELIEKRTKVKMEVVNTLIEDAEARLHQSSTPSTFATLLQLACAKGWLDVTRERDDSKIWPEWYPETIAEVIHRMYDEVPEKER